MPRGGYREGAGRKPGSANKRTREIADRAAEDGITPLEVMLDAMRQLYDAGDLKEAAEIAAKAAPYMHPRLASIEVSGDADKIQYALSDKPLSESEWEAQHCHQ